MAAITYVQPDGTPVTVEVKPGWSAMEGAVQNGVNGIVAECGGACACATCHVFVDPAWADRLPPATDMERDMLDCTAVPATLLSRLSCQIRVTADLAGLSLQIAAAQV